ncbi:MAG: arsenate reductase ArsC [Pseudomonadota bacterium]
MNILILCTGNSARSIIGEALVSAMPGFKGYSAGSDPKGTPHPMALNVLKAKGHDISTLRSKSWDEFGRDDAPQMDVIITVCDNAAGETCPWWPGHPVQVHWGLPDPAAVEEMNFQRAAFEDTYAALERRVTQLANLPLSKMSEAERHAAILAIHDRR